MEYGRSRGWLAALLVATACGGEGEDPTDKTTGASSASEPLSCDLGCKESVEIPDYGVTYGPCCDEDSGHICGAMLEDGCEGLHQLGQTNAQCPGTVSSIGTSLDGCCRPDGRCGVLSLVGFGCVERSDLNATAGGPLASIPCTP